MTELTGDAIPQETVFIPGEAPDFVVFIKAQGEHAQLHAIEGHFRWVITREDGTRYIARPGNAVVYNPDAHE